mgnify:CR=1 FL=1
MAFYLTVAFSLLKKFRYEAMTFFIRPVGFSLRSILGGSFQTRKQFFYSSDIPKDFIVTKYRCIPVMRLNSSELWQVQFFFVNVSSQRAPNRLFLFTKPGVW